MRSDLKKRGLEITWKKRGHEITWKSEGTKSLEKNEDPKSLEKARTWKYFKKRGHEVTRKGQDKKLLGKMKTREYLKTPGLEILEKSRTPYRSLKNQGHEISWKSGDTTEPNWKARRRNFFKKWEQKQFSVLVIEESTEVLGERLLQQH